MSKKKGYHNVPGMRHRTKGGRSEAKPDGFDRSRVDTLPSLSDSWLDYLEQRAYSERTLAKTRWCLRDFLSWCQDRDLIDPATITKPILESYQRHLFHYRQKSGKPLGVTTQRDRLGTLQRFFRWLCKENHLPANPAADLELPRKPAKTLPKALSEDELAALFATADTSDVLGIRDRCMLELLYSCAIRRSELTSLDIEDVDPGRGLVSVRKGKGGKSRVLPLGDRAKHWFERYRDEARPRLELDTSERALFLSGYGMRLNPNYVGNWVKRTMKAVGIEKQGSCHLLRHSCATHMHDNGADIRFIQILLGHASLETTQIYTEVSIEKLREVHARTHPHGKNGEADQS
jgi:integrase/recombinase XerD